MAIFCTKGQKPKLYYRFIGDNSNSVISFDYSPIDVEISNTGSLGSNKCGNILGTWSMITSDDYTASSPLSYTGTNLESPIASGRSISCECSARNIYSDGSSYAGNIRIGAVKFTPNTGNSWTIQVRDASSGNLIFTNTKNSESPPTYKVNCDDGCPDGYCKCHSDSYPGYCCNDCGATAARINNLVQKVKALSDGR